MTAGNAAWEIGLVRNEELLEFIAESTYQYYVAQNSDTSYTDSLQTALAETEKSINYSEDGKILTLYEIDGGSGHSIRIPSGLVHHAKKSVLKRTLFFFLFPMTHTE